ncbi:hypothetical protein ACM615_24220, partial [Rahnella sp. PAMC25617]
KGKIIHTTGQAEQKAVIQNTLNNERLQTKGVVIDDEKDALFHYAVPILKQNEPVGYLFLHASYEPLNEIDGQLWLALAFCLGSAIIIIVFFGYRMSMKYVKPIDYATKVAKQLERGNY